jgi:hypothetical protein
VNTNGYDELDPIGRLIKGFPIKIDVSKDISLPGDMVVGQKYPFTLSIDGNYKNQGDTAQHINSLSPLFQTLLSILMVMVFQFRQVS